MTHGGERANAGNKTGSIRPKFSMYWSDDEVKEYIDWVKENYKKDTQLAKWAGDHLFGKAVQPIGSDDGKPIIVQFSNAFTPQETGGDNTESS